MLMDFSLTSENLSSRLLPVQHFSSMNGGISYGGIISDQMAIV